MELRPLRAISALAHAFCDPPGRKFSSHCKASHSGCLLRNRSWLLSPASIAICAPLLYAALPPVQAPTPHGPLQVSATRHPAEQPRQRPALVSGNLSAPLALLRARDHLQQLEHPGRRDVLVQHLAEDGRHPAVDWDPRERRE